MSADISSLDYSNFENRGGYNREHDRNLLVRFFVKPREDKEATMREGRPIFKDVEHIDIKVAGNRNAGACRPATEADKRRFPDHYRAFKERIESPDDMGTPLTEWPAISRSQAEELAFFNVRTVEQLANMADSQVSQFRGMFSLKERAKKFLEMCEKEKPLNEMQSQIDALKAENAKLQESLQKVLATYEGEDDENLNQRQKARAKKRAVSDAKEAAEA